MGDGGRPFKLYTLLYTMFVYSFAQSIDTKEARALTDRTRALDY